MRRCDEAVPISQELTKVAPNDSAGPASLGACLLNLKRYGEATEALEAAVKMKPGLGSLHSELGTAYLRAGDDEKALAAYQKTLELDPRPVMFNDIAYELAEANKKLDVALEYAQKAVRGEEEASQKVKLADLQVEDLGHASSLAAFWGTLGWVHFRIGNSDQAEKYLNAAWMLSLGGVEADHLAQVYEHQHKKLAAIRMYRLALFCFPPQGRLGGGEPAKTREGLERLSPGASSAERNSFGEVSDEVNKIRTVKLARLVPGKANADFFLVLTWDAKTSSVKVEDVRFIAGSEDLKSAGMALTSATFKVAFPDDGQTRILRRGTLGCYEYSGCSFTLLLTNQVRALN